MYNGYYEQPEVWKQELETYQVQVLHDILNVLPHDINNLLDIGCGNGIITNNLPKNINIIGLDISSEAIKHVKAGKLIASVLDIPFPDNSFDLVMANDMLEHIPEKDYGKACAELQRVAKKYLLITVPYMENLEARMKRCIKCGARYHLNHHQRAYDFNSVKNIFPNYKLNTVIFSGDEWRGDLDWHVQAQNYAGMEYARKSSGICMNCGAGDIANTLQVNQKLLDKLLTKQAFQVANQVETIEKLLLRTEIICLFSCSAASNIIPGSLSDKKCLAYEEITFFP